MVLEVFAYPHYIEFTTVNCLQTRFSMVQSYQLKFAKYQHKVDCQSNNMWQSIIISIQSITK